MYISMWDKDVDDTNIPVDLVDEFKFDFNEVQGANPKTITIPGVRAEPKSL